VTDDVSIKNVSATIPISVTADLVSPDELAKLRVTIDADKARDAEAARVRAQTISDTSNLPDDMVMTQAMGKTEGGGPFCNANVDHKPVIGFKINVGKWGDHTCFPVFEPIYDRPGPAPEDDCTILMAKPGYAVGSVTMNAGDGVNALCVRFMKNLADKLDPKDTYVSHWFGEKLGVAQTKLGGDGRLVYATFGRKGANYDQLGLVMARSQDGAEQVDDSTHN
jgi:hypothetical protein